MLFLRTIQHYCYDILCIIIIKDVLCKITCRFCSSIQSVACIVWVTECHSIFMRIAIKNRLQMLWGHFVGYVKDRVNHFKPYEF